MLSFHNQPVRVDSLDLIGKACDFSVLAQASDRALWKTLVQQFRTDVDDPHQSWRSEYWGKCMRGACMLQKLTGSDALYAILDETVRDMLTAQREDGRFTTYSTAVEFHGWDIWGRKYVLLGFLYFLDICRDGELKKTILAALERHADYIIAHIGPASEGKTEIYKASNNWLGINSSSILEPIVLLYEATGEERYKAFADYIIGCGMMDGYDFPALLEEGKTYPYQLPTTKAYEMMSCVEGMLEYYRVVGGDRYLTIGRNFARLVMESDITIIGTAGCTHELFDHSAVRQTVYYEGIMQETCVTVTWMKFLQKLYLLTGDQVYLDEMERSYYNAYLGCLNLDLNKQNQGLPYDSYAPLRYGPRGRVVGGRQTIDGERYYGCCAAIASLGSAMFAWGAVTVSGDTVSLNFYDSLRVTAVTESGAVVTVAEETDYPYDGTVHFAAESTKPCKIALRIPSWCGDARLNGKPVESGVVLDCDGSVSGVLRFEMPAVVHTAVGTDDPDSKPYFAVTRGPVVMAVDSRVSGDEVGGSVPVSPAVRADGTADCKPADAAVRHHLALSLPTADGSVTLIDYASAGADWDNGTKIACWIRRA